MPLEAPVMTATLEVLVCHDESFEVEGDDRAGRWIC